MRSKYSIVCFDVDSTLVSIEGVDLLAEGNEEVALLTEEAMSGMIPLEEVYGRRLDLIRPDRNAITDLADRYLKSMVSGAHETIESLQSHDVVVHLVTGGLELAVAPLAASFGIPSHRLHAVPLRFHDDGSYAGFDRHSPLTRSGGKETIVTDIRLRSKGRVAFVGDGVTDLETKDVVDLFIGFGGVRIREAVKEGSDVYVEAHDLREVLPYLLETT